MYEMFFMNSAWFLGPICRFILRLGTRRAIQPDRQRQLCRDGVHRRPSSLDGLRLQSFQLRCPLWPGIRYVLWRSSYVMRVKYLCETLLGLCWTSHIFITTELNYYSWWRGTVVERRSLAGELSLSCDRPPSEEW